MKKSILFVLPWLAVGGLERMQVTLANALSRRGHSVTVMTYQPGFDLKSELDPAVEFIYKLPKPHFGRKIPYIRHKLYDDGMWETRATPSVLYGYYVGNRKFDVEIGFFRGLSVKIISGSTNPDSVKLAWVHNDFKRCAGITSNFRDMSRVKEAYGRFDRIVCVSERAKDSFSEVIGYKDKTVTVYNMLPVDEIERKSREPFERVGVGLRLLSVGRLTEMKGCDRLINAAVKLKKEGFDFTLEIVGDGEDREKLENMIKAGGCGGLRLEGRQMNPYKYMRNADLYICSSRYEGYNLTVAEAMICGCPVLSTSCTGPTEILDGGRYGMLVENSEDGIYKGLRSFLENPALLEEYREKAKERLGFFDTEKLSEEIEALFEK